MDIEFVTDKDDVLDGHQQPLQLHPVAWWNLDTFLLSTISVAIDKLLNSGNTLWSKTDRDTLAKIGQLAEKYVYAQSNYVGDGELKKSIEAGNTALRMIAEFGVQRLWD